MVGIVIVSHSEKLADGVADIIRMMAPEVNITTAGGHEDGSYGISKTKIRKAMRAIEEEYGLIFLDLGSSVEVVSDLVDEFPKGKFIVMDCPIVEGAISAAVVAAGDAPLQDVLRISRESRNAFKF